MATVRFLAHGRSYDVEAPLGATLRDAAKLGHAPHGDACGGVCACSTCHVYVSEGRELLSGAEEDEEDVLDKAFDVRSASRLGCQARLAKEGLVVCEITRESLDAYYAEHPGEKDPRKG